MTMNKQELSECIRHWKRETVLLSEREQRSLDFGEFGNDTPTSSEWQAHDEAAAAIVEALAVLWGVFTERGSE